MGFFDFDAALFRLTNATTAGAFHAVEQFVFGLRQIAAVCAVVFRLETESFRVFKVEMRIRDLHVQSL